MENYENQKIGETYQHHSGNGDNAINKIVNIQGVLPEHLSDITRDIFSDLRKGDKGSAAIKLEAIESTTITPNTRPYLDALKLILGITNLEKSGDIETRLYEAYQNSEYSQAKDLFLSAILRLKILYEDTPSAKDIYDEATKTGAIGDFSKCEFLEHLACREDLISASKQRINSSRVKHSILHGLIRINEPDIALETYQNICRGDNSHEAKTIGIMINALILSQKISTKHFWLTTQHEKKEILSLISEANNTLHESDNSDGRLFNVIAGFGEYIGFGEDEEILNICWRKIEKWKANHSNLYAKLKAIKDNDHSDLNDVDAKGFELQHDPSKANELSEKIFSGNVTSQEAMFALFFCDLESLKKCDFCSLTIKKTFESEAQTSVLFLEIPFIVVSEKIESLEKEKLIKDRIEAIDDFNIALNAINPALIYQVAKLLNQKAYYSFTARILSGVVPDSPWISPIVIEYIQALYASHQFSTFDKILDELSPACQESIFYWNIKTNSQIMRGDFKRANSSSKKLLELAPTSTQAIFYRCFVLMRLRSNVSDFLKELDFSFLDVDDPFSLKILNIAGGCLTFNEIEPIIINFFLKNPTKNSIVVSSVHFGKVLDGSLGEYDIPKSENVGFCKLGINYSSGSQNKTVLIVSGEALKNVPESTYIVNEDSQLGETLLGLEENSEGMFGYKPIIVNKRLSPYDACIKIATEIRGDLNDGSDSFQMLEIPTDPEELVTFMTKLISRTQSEQHDEFLSSQNIPLLMKGKRVGENNPAKQALKIFTTKKIAKPSACFDLQSPVPEKMIMDVYSVVYLTLTGLVEIAYRHDIVITDETLSCLQKLLKDLEGDHFSLSVNDNNQLVRTTHEDLQRDLDYFIDDLKDFCQRVDVVNGDAIFSVDIPHDLNKVNDFMDPTVFNTVIAGYALNRHWLSIDTVIGTVVSGFSVNFYSLEALLHHQALSFSFEKRLHGIKLSSLNFFRFPLFVQDVRALMASDRLEHQYILKNILLNSGESIINHEAFSIALTAYPLLLCSRVIDSKCLFNRVIAKSLLNTVLKMQIAKEDGNKAEFKLALSFYNVANYATSKKINPDVIAEHYAEFIRWHFLSLDAVNNYLGEIPRLKNQLPTDS